MVGTNLVIYSFPFYPVLWPSSAQQVLSIACPFISKLLAPALVYNASPLAADTPKLVACNHLALVTGQCLGFCRSGAVLAGGWLFVFGHCLVFRPYPLAPYFFAP
jgi:hypothetical protein